MEQQIPMALQAALYAGSVAIVVMVAFLIVLLLQFRRQIERVVRAVDELKVEVIPLAKETRIVVGTLRDLSEQVQERWLEVKGILDMARSWSQRASHLVEGIGCVVRALSRRKPELQQKARVS
jgi:uncharacterized protein YoxC